MTASKLEALFAAQLKTVGLKFEGEFAFADDIGRKWRADFRVGEPVGGHGFSFVCDHGELQGHTLHAPAMRPSPLGSILIEIQGTGPQGRHGSFGHHDSDCEKLSTAAALGWRVLPLSAKMVENGTGLALVEAALGLRALEPYRRKPRRSKLKAKRVAGKGLPERVLRAVSRAKNG